MGVMEEDLAVCIHGYYAHEETDYDRIMGEMDTEVDRQRDSHSKYT